MLLPHKQQVQDLYLKWFLRLTGLFLLTPLPSPNPPWLQLGEGGASIKPPVLLKLAQEQLQSCAADTRLVGSGACVLFK